MTGFGPNLSANADAASVPTIAPRLSTSRKVSADPSGYPASLISSGNQVFSP